MAGMETNNIISDFVTMRGNFQRGIQDYLKDKNVAAIIKIQKEIHASEGDKRMALEQSIRDRFLTVLTENPSDVENFKQIICLCIELVEKECLAPVMSVTLLSDMFDTVTLTVAEALFEYVQESLPIWKSDLFFAPCKNVILRMCNDLLRRLPRAKNTRFCGQILLFLALFFPFSERSGLNIISEFNLENITKQNENPNINLEGDVITSIIPEQLTSKVNNEFYTKFWSLQEVFRNPTLCYNDVKWKDFVENSESVLKLFSNCKTERSSSSRSSSKVQIRNQSYTMKYLTSEKLLVLQLNDINFRRVLFLQYLILFQYLRSFVKSRPESYDLTAEQVEWIKKSTSTLQKLCRESSPDGNKFFKTIQKILERDSYWNRWKNESCPALKRKKPTVTKDLAKIAKFNFEFSLADIYEQSKNTNKMVVTSSTGKHKEWTVKADYLKQCKNFPNHPNLKSRIEDIVLEADPAAKIEEKYKKVSNMKFVWQTLKLYHQKGPARCFNSPAQAVPNKIPEYVEYMSKQISRDITFKAIQARIKKQAGELKARQENRSLKDDKDKDDGTKADSDDKVDENSPLKEEDDEDDDKMEVEAVDLEEEATSDEDAKSEHGSTDKESEEEQDNEEMETQDSPSSQTNGEVGTKSEEEKKDKVAKEDLEKIAKEISSEWKKVGDKLGYKADEIEYFSAQEEEEYDRGLYMLDVWFSNESDANLNRLFKALDSLGLTEACNIVESLTKT